MISALLGPLWGESTCQRASDVELWSFLWFSLNRLMDNQSNNPIFEKPWRSCDIIVTVYVMFRCTTISKKLNFQSKLDLCSGNHVVYRQTDGRTDGQGESIIPPSNFVGRWYNNVIGWISEQSVTNYLFCHWILYSVMLILFACYDIDLLYSRPGGRELCERPLPDMVSAATYWYQMDAE